MENKLAIRNQNKQTKSTLAKLYKAIRMGVLILISLSLIYSVQSNILYLDQLSDKFILFLFLSLITLFLLITFKTKETYKPIFIFLKSHQKLLFWTFFTFCILYQIFLMINLKAVPFFDAARFTLRINDESGLSNYLSINSNNRLLYFINLAFTALAGSSVIKLQLFNTILIFSSSLIFLKLTNKLFDISVAYLSTYCLMMIAIIQPLYLVPYTDTYCLLPMFLTINFLIDCIQSKNSAQVALFSFLAAFFLTVTYLIRPSSIVFIIATAIFLLLNIKNKEVQKRLIVGFPTIMVTIIVTVLGFNMFVSNQTIIKIDRSKEFPFTHFLLMGSFGDENTRDALHGTWNAEDITTTYSGQTKKEKSKLAVAALKKRTKSRGLTRTIKFYWQKYIQNTDAGVIGFHRDGLWLTSDYSSEGSLKNKVQQIYYEDGRLRPTFNFLCQIFWLLILVASAVALYSTKSWKIALIALSLFGGLLFLELFESGGTKYLFQYIPLYCLLAGVGIKKISNLICTHLEK